MNRRQRLRARARDRVHRSRLGWIGRLTNAAEGIGCCFAGHRPFADEPGQCLHCGADLDVRQPPAMVWFPIGVALIAGGIAARSWLAIAGGVVAATVGVVELVRYYRTATR